MGIRAFRASKYPVHLTNLDSSITYDLENSSRYHLFLGIVAYGKVYDVEVIDEGKGYDSAPLVAFSRGGGTSAEAEAYVEDGRVLGVILTSGGVDYYEAPTVTIAMPNSMLAGGRQATARALMKPNGRSRYWKVVPPFEHEPINVPSGHELYAWTWTEILAEKALVILRY